ncbi:potassium transporter TrkA [Nocardia neocaledoniensis NBRC 108232]|uniref:cation:proton antiporter regulatory subunit n=1 Tax=Nocardia TaxID=1817 RepID=UPI001192A9E2|nr:MULTISPECIES: TrkA C-terminal domain-containing protein [Nocardia]UGT56248.1 potassium transporter TrkA [Nocardia asteroides]GEM34486.1 potassium transporter TrkA [Nocardia neocaledoniensis NBRC 108232]
MNIDVTPLPGIGVCKDFPLAQARRRIGVVEHRDGSVDLVVSRAGDYDTTTSIPLSGTEIGVLAGLLGAPQVVQKTPEVHGVGELTTRQFAIDRGSPFDGRPLRDTAMRTRTKASVVAVVRAGDVTPSPGTDFTFIAGDLVVVVGTDEGLEAAGRLLDQG